MSSVIARTIGHDFPIKTKAFFEIPFFPSHDWYRNSSCLGLLVLPLSLSLRCISKSFHGFSCLKLIFVFGDLWLFDFGKIFCFTWIGSLLFGCLPVSSIFHSKKMSRMKEDRCVRHIILIDHFYNYLNHYKPFAKRSLLIRSDRALDIA